MNLKEKPTKIRPCDINQSIEPRYIMNMYLYKLSCKQCYNFSRGHPAVPGIYKTLLVYTVKHNFGYYSILLWATGICLS